MKMIVAFAFALVAVVVAAPVQEETIPIVRSNYEQKPDGGYDFGYETGNGIIRIETGDLKQVVDAENKPQVVLVVRGSYEYPSEDGKKILVNYIADDQGYRAEGDSIPKGPARR